MDGASIATIIVAIIGGAFGLWAAFISRGTQKSTKTIKDVLANTKSPVDSLDRVIKAMQDEFKYSAERHEKEIRYLDTQVGELQEMLKHCQHERSGLTVELESLRKLVVNHDKKLNGNGH